MSHELRTPLNAIIGYSQMLLEYAEEEGHFARDVDRIHCAGAHLLHLVEDILDFSNIEAGKMVISATVSGEVQEFKLAELLPYADQGILERRRNV